MPDPVAPAAPQLSPYGQYIANLTARANAGDKAAAKKLKLAHEGEQRDLRKTAASGYLAASQNFKPFDYSFRTPEYIKAQQETTIDPINREFGLAQQRGLGESLRTGGPVGALYSSLAGQQGDVLKEVGGQNYLNDVNMAANAADRKFANLGAGAGFGEGQRQFDVAHPKKSGLGQALGSLAQIGGTIVGGALGNRGPAAGGQVGGTSPGVNMENFGLRRPSAGYDRNRYAYSGQPGR